MGIISEVTLKEFKTVGLRLVTYSSDDRGGRIDLYEAGNPIEVIFEGYYNHRANAVEQFEALDTEKKAINWAYRNS